RRRRLPRAAWSSSSRTIRTAETPSRRPRRSPGTPHPPPPTRHWGAHPPRAHVARDGRSGIALAREIRPDVIFCDIGLPDMDGFEVARAIRKEAGLAGVRLIALTGYAQPEDLAHATEAGFDFHVAKPADLNKVYRLLR